MTYSMVGSLKLGLLTLIKKVPQPENKKRKGTYWLCECACGQQCIKHYQDLYSEYEKR